MLAAIRTQANTLPTLSKLGVEKTRRPTPLADREYALSDLNDSAIYSSPSSPRQPSELPLPRSREAELCQLSRSVSYHNTKCLALQGTVTSLQRGVLSREQSGTSSPASKAPSVEGSRPSSPSPRTPGDSPRLPRTDLDWSALMAANASRRPKNSSRLATSQLRMPQMPRCARVLTTRPFARSYSAAPPARAGTMPYPDK